MPSRILYWAKAKLVKGESRIKQTYLFFMPSRILYWAKAKLVKGESKGKNGGNEILSLNYAEPHPIVCNKDLHNRKQIYR